jgi:endonuclease/exonuclease/phosphatase family metal-dependent hydrolase
MTSDVAVGPPYGELITSTLRVLTWNVWGRFGPWKAREAALINTLKVVQPDIVALQECWCAPDGETQAARLGQALGYHHAYGGGTFLADDWGTGSGLLSRWPIQSHEYREFPAIAADRWGGSALFGRVDGPRGVLPVFSVGLDWPPHASAVRQASIGHLVAFVGEMAVASFPPIVCGDFNTGPDADEIRSLTGRRDTVAPGFVLFDAWEMAGNGSGHTWARTNPWTARSLLPDKRIDYILVGWPRRGGGGGGHVLRCSIEGVEPADGVEPSDHYAVCAELRY